MSVPSSNGYTFSDEDDLHIFRSSSDPELAKRIIRVKHDEPGTEHLHLSSVDSLNEIDWPRLGVILGQNTNLKELRLKNYNVDMAGLGAGLRNNKHIRSLEFLGIDLQGAEKLSSLAPFLSYNPSLKVILLEGCNLGPAGISILSTVLLNRPEDTLEALGLSSNGFGDIDLDELFLNSCRIRNLRMLLLDNNGIGRNGCNSLSKLLENQESNLEQLDLSYNSIDKTTVLSFWQILWPRIQS